MIRGWVMSQRVNSEVNRREFLGTGSAAAMGLLGLSTLSNAEEKKMDPFGGFTLGIQSYTFREFDLEPTLKRIQEMGLHYVEFYDKHCPSDSSPAKINSVLKICKDYGVTPIAFGVTPFTKNHDNNKK